MQKTKKGGSGFKAALIGCGVISAVYLLLIALVCAICSFTQNPTENIELYSMLALVLSGGAGTFISAKLFDTGGTLSAIFPATLALCVYVLLSFIISRAALSLPHAMNMLCFISVSAFSAFIACGKRKRRHAVRKK